MNKYLEKIASFGDFKSSVKRRQFRRHLASSAGWGMSVAGLGLSVANMHYNRKRDQINSANHAVHDQQLKALQNLNRSIAKVQVVSAPVNPVK